MTPPPRIDDRRGVLLCNKTSIFVSLFFFNFILLIFLLVFYKDVYEALTSQGIEDDTLFENGTAFLFFLTALLLFAISAVGRDVPSRWFYILSTLAFVFAAGEEISWGQRIFGLVTPDFLRAINSQRELNIHNIEGVLPLISRGYRTGIVLICVVTSAAYFARKSSLFGIPFPSIPIMFCFLVVYSYRPYDLVGGFPLSIVSAQYLFPLLFFAYASFSKERRLLILSLLFLSVIILEQFIIFTFAERPMPASIWEAYEYLFSVACVGYAGELFLRTEPWRRS